MYAYFNRDSYDLFERDLTVLSQVLDREQSCCAVAHANLYGCGRPASIHHFVVIHSFIEEDVQNDTMQLKPY